MLGAELVVRAIFVALLRIDLTRGLRVLPGVQDTLNTRVIPFTGHKLPPQVVETTVVDPQRRTDDTPERAKTGPVSSYVIGRPHPCGQHRMEPDEPEPTDAECHDLNIRYFYLFVKRGKRRGGHHLQDRPMQ